MKIEQRSDQGREADEHWRRVLAGLELPTPLPFDRVPVVSHATHPVVRLSFDPREVQSIEVYEFAKGNRLTLNSIFQAIWVLLLSLYRARRDVFFDATVPGRPTDPPEVDATVGIFINTFPVRVYVGGRAGVIEWLQELQSTQAQAYRFNFVPLARLQTWSELPGGMSLFDSLVVFNNYPINDEVAATHGAQIRAAQAVKATNYPLTVAVCPRPRLPINFHYDSALFNAATMKRIAKHLTRAFYVMIESVFLFKLGEVRSEEFYFACRYPRIWGAAWHHTIRSVRAGTSRATRPRRWRRSARRRPTSQKFARQGGWRKRLRTRGPGRGSPPRTDATIPPRPQPIWHGTPEYCACRYQVAMEGIHEAKEAV